MSAYKKPPPEITEPPDLSRESLLEQLRALPRVVWILFVGLFIHRFGTFVIPFLTLYLTDNGYPAKDIAIIFASMAVGGIGAMALGGRLSDLIGRKNTMAIALIGGACSMILMWQADSLVSYVVSIFFVGITHGMYHPASNSLLVDVVPPERRVTAFAVVRWAVNLGFACGMAAGGFLAEKNYGYLFVGDAITSALFGLLALFTLPHGVRTAKKLSRWGPALRDMANNPLFLRFLLSNLLTVSAFLQWGSAVARLIVDLGYSKQAYGWLMFGNGILIAFMEIPLSQITRKLTPHRVIAFGSLLCGVGVWINGFADGYLVIVVAMLIFTVGEMISMPVSGAYVAAMAPETMRGRYSAAVGSTWNIGHSVAPGVGLILYLNAPQVLWWGSLVLGIVACALMLGGYRKKG